MTNPQGQSGDAVEHQSVGDHHVRELLERYVKTAGTTLTEVAPNLFDLAVPREDRTAFNQRANVRIAFSVEAVQTDSEAEMAIMGGAFVEQLIGAIRNRGAVFAAGFVGGDAVDTTTLPTLPVTVRRGKAGDADSKVTRHRLGRLTARVVIRAGTALEEHLVDSGIFDLTTGHALGHDVAIACEAQLSAPATSVPALADLKTAPVQPIGDLVSKMLGNLEQLLAPQLKALGEKSERDLAHETGRIQRYYQTLLEDLGGRGTDVPDRDSRRVYESERNRRISEESDRHEVRATVHPVQLTQWEVLVQRVDWAIQGDFGTCGDLTAQRTLAGSRSWTIGCPSCGSVNPREVSVCLRNHVACEKCSHDCSVCSSPFCADHGLRACHVDGKPACANHARSCKVCQQAYCADHEGECSDGGHVACTTCLSACALCARTICNRHAELSGPGAPRGSRRFCHDCARKCEGGSGEIVGKDEVAQCASCQNVVCQHHQASCAVDGKVHCSKHLRRTDRSRRLVCEHDRAACSYEDHAVFASDEIRICSTCGREGCEQHVGSCAEDGRAHCTSHMSQLRDQPGKMACAEHFSTCHVDGGVFSRTATSKCVLCAKGTCTDHFVGCGNCGRNVCSSDIRGASNSCATCNALKENAEPSEAILTAANELFERAGRAKSWKSARDATHTVVEADLGWTRKVIFAIRNDDKRLEHAISRSALGSKRLRPAKA